VSSWHDLFELSVDALISVPAGTARWKTGKWGTDHWTALAGDWQTVQCDEMLSMSFGAGRSSLVDNFNTGTMTMTVRNPGGWAAGRPRPGQLTLLPGVPLRVRARVIGGTWYVIWVGEVDKLSTHWDIGGDVISTLNGVDTMAQLAVVTPPTTNAPVESIDGRMARIAALTGRSKLTFQNLGLSIGSGTVQASPLTQQLVTEATLTANTFGAVVGASPSTADRLVFMDSAMSYMPFTTATAPFVISNRGTAGQVAVCPLTFAADGPDVTTVANQVRLAARGGSVVTVNSTSSQALFALRTWGRSDLLTYDAADVTALANAHLKYRAVPRPRYKVSYHVPGSIYGGQLSEWLRWAVHPLAASEQNVVRAAGLPLRIDWDAGTEEAPWHIDVVGYGVEITHAITPDDWVVSMDIDLPGLTAVTATEAEEAAA
jgi:hypothetical protein